MYDGKTSPKYASHCFDAKDSRFEGSPLSVATISQGLNVKSFLIKLQPIAICFLNNAAFICITKLKHGG
jgi:hypothetical protein